MPPLLLDGPMGTELQRHGADTTLPLWSARALDECPELVRRIHVEYLEAGADVITTNSFRTNRRAIIRSGMRHEDAVRLTALSVQLARESIDASNRPLLVAGSDAPLEDCYSPNLVPSDHDLRIEHREHCAWLMEAGCDFLLLETMNSLREAVAAAAGARELGASFMISLVTDRDGERMLGGEAIVEAIDALEPYEPMAILTNCSAPDAVLRAAEILASFHDQREGAWMFGGYANSGVPDPILGWDLVETLSVERFVERARQMIMLGAGVIGSCCGTTPEHTAALRRAVNEGAW